MVYDGERWEESRDDIVRWCGTPSMQCPVENLLEGEEIALNNTITELRKTSNGKWALCSLENGWYDDLYDVVVIALPAPQANALVRNHSSTLELISKETVMKGCWALMLQYDLPNAVGIPFEGAFINDKGPLSWITRDSFKPGRSPCFETWLLHATSAWSNDNIDRDADEVSSELLKAFCSLKFPHDTTIPPPDSCVVHRWLYATTHPNLDMNSLWDAKEMIGICGDWVNVGKVEGAWQSGSHLAGSVFQK